MKPIRRRTCAARSRPVAGRRVRRVSPYTVMDHNFFAFFLTQMGEYELARKEFDKLGHQLHRVGWEWFGNPILVFRECRKGARHDGKV